MTDDARNVGSIKVGIYADIAGLETSLKKAQATVAATVFSPKDMVVRIDTLQPTREAFSGLRQAIVKGIGGQNGKNGVLIPLRADEDSIGRMVLKISKYLAQYPIDVKTDWAGWGKNAPPLELSMVVYGRWGGWASGGGPPEGAGGGGGGGGPVGGSPARPAGWRGGGAAAPATPAATTAKATGTRAPSSRPVQTRASAPAAAPAPGAPILGPTYVAPVAYTGPTKTSTGGVVGRTGTGSELGLRPAMGAKQAAGLSQQLRSALQLAMQGDSVKLGALAARLGVPVHVQSGDLSLGEPDKNAVVHMFSLGGQAALPLMHEALAHARGRKPIQQILDELPPGVIEAKELGMYRGAGGEKVRTPTAELVSSLKASHDRALAAWRQVRKDPSDENFLAFQSAIGSQGYADVPASGLRGDLNSYITADPRLARAMAAGKPGMARLSDDLTKLLGTSAGLIGAEGRLRQEFEQDVYEDDPRTGKPRRVRMGMRSAVIAANKKLEAELRAGRGTPYKALASGGPVEGSDDAIRRRIFGKSGFRERMGLPRLNRDIVGKPLLDALGNALDIPPDVEQDIFSPIGDELFAKGRRGHIATSLLGREFRPHAAGGPVEGFPGPLGKRLAEARKAREYLVGEKRPEMYRSTSGRYDRTVGDNGPEITSFPEAGKIEPYVPEWVRRGMLAKDLTHRAEGGPVEGGERLRYPAGTPLTDAQGRQVGGRYVKAEELTQAIAGGFVKAAGPFFDAYKKSSRQSGNAPVGGNVGGQTPFEALEGIGNLKLSPQQEANARINAFRKATPGLIKGVEVRSEFAKEISLQAQRSAPLALGQISSTLAGRATSIEKAKLGSFYAGRATIAENQARGFEEEAQRARERIAEVRERARVGGVSITDPAIHAELLKQGKALKDNSEAAKAWRKEAKYNISEAEGFAEQIGGAGKVLKNFSAQLGGAFAGTLLYGGAFTILNAGISEFIKNAEPAADLLSGFYLTSVKVSAGLRDATTQAQGNAKAVAAQAVAQTGLSGAIGDSTAATLSQRAAGEAANKNLAAQLDLIRSAHQINQQNGGFFAANNIDASTLLGTGGFGPRLAATGGQFGGQQSTLETVANAFRNVGGGRPDELQQGAVSAIPFVGPLLSQFTKNIRGGFDQGLLDNTVAGFNADLRKGGSGAQFRTGATGPEQTQTLQGLAALARAVPEAAGEIMQFQRSLADTGTAIVDVNGKVITSAGDLAAAFDALKKGALVPSAAGLVAGNERQRQAQLGALQQQVQQQLAFSIPAQEFLQTQQNRPLPFGAGVLPTGGKGFGGFGATGPGAGAFPGLQGITDNSLAAIKQFADQGQKAISAIVPADLLNQFNALSDQLYNLNLDAATQQANLSATQYNHQLFLAKRNLADAAALAGKHAGIENGLVGTLERETFELQKQSTALSLQLQQRQINFNLALASFQAPGETSEERAARQKEAILEATYAQKQLNIAKKEFGVGIRLFDEQSRRGLQEARFALADLQASRSVAIRIALDQQAAAAVGRHINMIASRIGVAINKQESLVAGAIAETAQIVAATGEGFAEVLKLTAKAWGVFTQQGVDAVNALTNEGRPPDKDWVKYPHDGYTYASGGLFNTSGAMQATIGEAGRETVAILRNPRMMNLGVGGGASVTILVTGNTVRDQSDLEYLAKRVTMAVERSINNKASLLNMRSV